MCITIESRISEFTNIWGAGGQPKIPKKYRDVGSETGGNLRFFSLVLFGQLFAKRPGLIGGEEVVRSERNHKLSIFSLLKRTHFYSNSFKKIEYLTLIFLYFVHNRCLHSNLLLNTLTVCILNHYCQYNLPRIRISPRAKISDFLNLKNELIFQVFETIRIAAPPCLTETTYEQILFCT